MLSRLQPVANGDQVIPAQTCGSSSQCSRQPGQKQASRLQLAQDFTQVVGTLLSPGGYSLLTPLSPEGTHSLLSTGGTHYSLTHSSTGGTHSSPPGVLTTLSLLSHYSLLSTGGTHYSLTTHSSPQVVLTTRAEWLIEFKSKPQYANHKCFVFWVLCYRYWLKISKIYIHFSPTIQELNKDVIISVHLNT